jgi:hypothetical protein
MNQMQADEELRLARSKGTNRMLVPDVIEQGVFAHEREGTVWPTLAFTSPRHATKAPMQSLGLMPAKNYLD